MSAIVLIECVPPSKYGEFVSYIGIVAALAGVLGPIIGGAISERTTWRWIFLFKYAILLSQILFVFHDYDTHSSRSVPFGVVALALAVVGVPKNFPYHGQRNRAPTQTWSKATLSRMDIPGFILLVMATLSFTACFQEADSRFPWNSAFVITLLIGTVVIWSALLWWERRVTLGETLREPVLPWRFIQNRAMVGILLY